MWLFFLLISIFILWFLQNRLFQKYWSKGLSVFLQFQDSYIFEEETSALKEIVTNDKLLPLAAISVRLSMDRNLAFLRDASENSDISDQTYKRDIFSFLFHQQITRTLPFLGKKRGFYSIESADATAYDFFFQQGYYKSFSQQTQLFVYPKPADISRIRLISQAISGSILSKNRIYPDPFEFSGIREYRREDPMNHINWKASARTGDLMVNQHDSTTNFSITVFLDMEDPYILKYEALTEESVRIAASLAAYLVNRRMPLRMVSNSIDVLLQDPSFLKEKKRFDSSDALDVFLPSGAGKMSELYRKLSCVDSSHLACHMAELLNRRELSSATGETYLVISKNCSPELVEALRRLTKSQNEVLWVMPVFSYNAGQYFDDPRLHIMHWEVEV